MGAMNNKSFLSARNIADYIAITWIRRLTNIAKAFWQIINMVGGSERIELHNPLRRCCNHLLIALPDLLHNLLGSPGWRIMQIGFLIKLLQVSIYCTCLLYTSPSPR